MRLTCPTCGAEYQIADAMVPAAGRHVQCTACHTRWYARGAAPAETTEDEIMRRLEARSGLRVVPMPEEPGPAQADEPAGEAPPPEPAPLVDEAPDEAPSESASEEAAGKPPAATPPIFPAPVTAAPAKPAQRPMLSNEGPMLRPAPRLDLGAEALSEPARPAPPEPRRFGRGVVTVLVIFGIALATYVWRAELGSAVPAAAPALDAYGRAVDDLRLSLGERIEQWRKSAGG